MVAPPGNQSANGENKLQPAATEVPGLLDRSMVEIQKALAMPLTVI
jgi:hypothetical protein